MPYYIDNNKRIHDMVVYHLLKALQKKYPRNRFSVNFKIKRSGGGPLVLLDGSPYLADIADEDDKIVYEVHWRGERKEKQFDNLPPPWKGVNVFIDDWNTPFTIVVKVPDVEFAFIERSKFVKDL